MICPECQKDIPIVDAIACPYCAAKLSATDQEVARVLELTGHESEAEKRGLYQTKHWEISQLLRSAPDQMMRDRYSAKLAEIERVGQVLKVQNTEKEPSTSENIYLTSNNKVSAHTDQEFEHSVPAGAGSPRQYLKQYSSIIETRLREMYPKSEGYAITTSMHPLSKEKPQCEISVFLGAATGMDITMVLKPESEHRILTTASWTSKIFERAGLVAALLTILQAIISVIAMLSEDWVKLLSYKTWIFLILITVVSGAAYLLVVYGISKVAGLLFGGGRFNSQERAYTLAKLQK